MGAVCQCQHDNRSMSTEIDGYSSEVNLGRDPRYHCATEKFETEEMDYQREVDKIWEEYDIDRDGKLNKDEAYAFLKTTLKEQMGTEPCEDDLERNFHIMDED